MALKKKQFGQKSPTMRDALKYKELVKINKKLSELIDIVKELFQKPIDEKVE